MSLLIGVGPAKDDESIFPTDPRAQIIDRFFADLSQIESAADHILIMQTIIVAFLKAHPAYATGIAPMLHDAVTKGCGQ